MYIYLSIYLVSYSAGPASCGDWFFRARDLSIYLYMYVYIYTHTYIYIYKHNSFSFVPQGLPPAATDSSELAIYLSLYICMYVYTHTHTHTHTHIYIYIYIYIYVCMCVCIYVHMSWKRTYPVCKLKLCDAGPRRWLQDTSKRKLADFLIFFARPPSCFPGLIRGWPNDWSTQAPRIKWIGLIETFSRGYPKKGEHPPGK